MRWLHADTGRTVNMTVELELTAVIRRRRVSIIARVMDNSLTLVITFFVSVILSLKGNGHTSPERHCSFAPLQPVRIVPDGQG